MNTSFNAWSNLLFPSSDIQSLEELNQKVEESYTKVATGCWTCNHCDKSFKFSSHAKEHVFLELSQYTSYLQENVVE